MVIVRNGSTDHSPSSSTHTKMIDKDSAKRNAAYHCVDRVVRSGMRVGVGTGTTSKHLVAAIRDKYRTGALSNLVLVPTSVQTRQMIIDEDLPLSDLDRTPKLDICMDGADEIDSQLNCIKGGGGCLTLEKIVMSCAERFILIGDWSKKSSYLGEKYKSIPIEVLPRAVRPVQIKIQKEFGGRCVVREAVKKAGPMVTDNGNYVIDWQFPTDRDYHDDWAALNTKLTLIPGVVETGLFIGVAERVYYGQQDSTVSEFIKETSKR